VGPLGAGRDPARPGRDQALTTVDGDGPANGQIAQRAPLISRSTTPTRDAPLEYFDGRGEKVGSRRYGDRLRTIHEGAVSRRSGAAPVRPGAPPRAKDFDVGPGNRGLAFEARALWCLGYPERASERGLAAPSMDRMVAHPLSLCVALREEAMLRILRREPELIAARTKAYCAVAREQGFAYDCALGSMLEIWHETFITGRCADGRIDDSGVLWPTCKRWGSG
jgi:hypothetical protein